MARASVATKLSLDRWAALLHLNPLHFNQVQFGEVNPFCTDMWLQHEWQTADAVSREEVAQAIAEAESKIESVLKFHLVPSWDIDEWHPTTRSFRKEFVNLGTQDIRGFGNTVRANWGYVISGGRQAKQVIDSSASITWEDLDSDGYFETGSVTAATIAIDPEEIAIYYPDKDGEDEWEIRPTRVTISGGIATVKFRRELAVLEDLQEALTEPRAADGEDDNDFLETVAVWRRYNDPQTQVSFLWEPFAGGSCSSCNGSGCSACSYTTQTGCLLIRGDPRNSKLVYHPADWNGTTFEFDKTAWAVGRDPDIVRLFYYSGLRNKNQKYTNRMDPQWERIVAYMACAYLDRPPCSCAEKVVDYWRTDLLLTTGDEDGKAIFAQAPDKSYLDNPFGSRRGEVNAWRRVRREAILEGITPTSV